MLVCSPKINTTLGLFIRFRGFGCTRSGASSAALGYTLTPQYATLKIIRGRRKATGLRPRVLGLYKKNKRLNFMLLPASVAAGYPLKLLTAAGFQDRTGARADYSIASRLGRIGELGKVLPGPRRAWRNRLKLLARLRKDPLRRRYRKLRLFSKRFKVKIVDKPRRKGSPAAKVRSRRRIVFGYCTTSLASPKRRRLSRRRFKLCRLMLNSLARGLMRPVFSKKRPRSLSFRRRTSRSGVMFTADQSLFGLQLEPQLQEYIKNTWPLTWTSRYLRQRGVTAAQNHIALWAAVSMVGARAPEGAARRVSFTGLRNRPRRWRVRSAHRLTFGLKVVRLPVRFRTGCQYVRKLLTVRALFKRPLFKRQRQRFFRYFAPNVHTQPLFVYKPKKPWTDLQRRAYRCKRYSVGGRGRKGVSLAKRSSALTLQKPVLTMRRWFGGRVSSQRGLRRRRFRLRKKSTSSRNISTSSLFF